jgi:hypothetical protein
MSAFPLEADTPPCPIDVGSGPVAAVRLLGSYSSLQLEEEVMRYRYEAGADCFGARGSLPSPGIVN